MPILILAVILVCAAGLLGFWWRSQQSMPTPVFAGQAVVVDGDTIQIAGRRIRLWGIDAPEAAQTCRRREQLVPCGAQATAALTELVRGKQVTCAQNDIDVYGRVVAVCRVTGQEINAWLVEHGQAVAYRQYGGSVYDSAQAQARAARLGLWAGTFTWPWAYRRQQVSK